MSEVTKEQKAAAKVMFEKIAKENGLTKDMEALTLAMLGGISEYLQQDPLKPVMSMCYKPKARHAILVTLFTFMTEQTKQMFLDGPTKEE